MNATSRFNIEQEEVNPLSDVLENIDRMVPIVCRCAIINVLLGYPFARAFIDPVTQADVLFDGTER